MSAAAVGEAGLRCPECGKVATDASKFGKSRRARWMAALALFFLGTGWYGVIAGPRVAETEEWLAAVPTWVLMAGWQVFPEEWIIEDNTKLIVYESCLSNRLNDYFEYDSVADWHRVRFGRRLLKGMLRSTEARWDPARLELLDSVSWELTQSKVY